MSDKTNNYWFRAKSTGFDKVKTDVNQTANALRGLQDTLKYTNSMTDKQTGAFNKLGTSMKNLGTIASFVAIGKAIRGLINLSNQYVENLNLFMVQMGDYAQKGMDHINKLVSNFGVNPSEAMRYMGFFMNLAQGMGVASDQAFIMSKNMTNLGYDLSSLLNIDIDAAMLKIQSGLAGELEPLRRVGYALSMNSLQEYLNRYSKQAKKFYASTKEMQEATKAENNENILAKQYIDRKVLSLTDAEKAQLRYAVLMDETTLAQGDMGRTLNTPANMLRVFRQNVLLAGMSLGNIFIPALNAIIPIAIAVVQVIKSVADVIATLFGFKLPTIDWGSIDRGNDSLNGTADAVDDTNKGLDATAKKLKDLRAPFDELNVFKDTASSSGTGSGGVSTDGAGISDAMFDKLKQYDDFIKNNVMKHIADIRDGILEWLGVANGVSSWSELWDTRLGHILSVVGHIAEYIVLMKIRSAAMKSWAAFSTLLDAILVKMGTMETMWMGMGAGGKKGGGKGGGIGPLSSGGMLTGPVVEGAEMGAGAAGMEAMVTKTEKLRKLLQGVFRFLGKFKIPLVIAGVKFAELYASSSDFRQGIENIGNVLGTVFGGFKTIGDGIDSFFNGILEKIGLGDVKLGGVATTLGAIGLLFTPAAPLAGAYLVVEGLGLAIEGIGAASEPALSKIDVFGQGVDKTTKENLQPFLETIDSLKTKGTEFDLGNLVVKDSDVQEVSTKMGTIADTIEAGLDKNKNKALDMVNSMKDAFSGPEYAALISEIGKGYDKQKEIVENKQEEIVAIWQGAANEHRSLTEDESAKIQELMDDMTTQGVQAYSDSAIESQIILENIKSNTETLTAEAGAAAIKNAKDAKEKTIAEAQEQYDSIIFEAKKMENAGIISETEYNKIKAAAKTTKDSAIADANTQFTTIRDTVSTELGNTAKYVDLNTGTMKSKWEMFCEGVGTAWKGNGREGVNASKADISNLKTQANENIQLIKDKWKSFTDKIKDNWNNAGKNTIDAVKKKFDELKASLLWLYDNVLKPIGNWFENVFGAQGKMITVDSNTGAKTVITRHAKGGFPAVGEMFIANEAGPELIGRMGSRTAVANQDQITTGIAQGVSSALVQTLTPMLSRVGGGSQPMTIYLDGDVIYNNQQKVAARKGFNFGLGAYTR